MKTNRSLLSATGLVAAIFAAGMPIISAQTVDTSSGTVLDSSGTPSGVVKPSSSPKKLTAAILPTEENAKVNGTLTFTPSGDAINVSGRIEGLEPNKQYHLMVESMGPNEPAKEEDARLEAPSQAGRPEAGPPVAGAPVAGSPEAPAPSAGKPDGESRPGAPGGGSAGTGNVGTRSSKIAGSSKSPAASSDKSGDLGMFTTDSTGSTNVSSTIRATGTDGLVKMEGSSVKLATVPDGQDNSGVQIASGEIIAVKTEAQKKGEASADEAQSDDTQED